MLDRVGARADAMREFPFDCTVTDKELYFIGYGKGLKSGAKLTALIQASTLFANSTPNKMQTLTDFKLKAATDTDKEGEASQPTGMVKFKFAATKWGGSCCKSGTCADGGDSVKACNLDTGNNINLFATNSDKQIAHGYHDKKGTSKKFNALTSIKFTKLFDMPAASCTTLRGKGGLGASSQALMDVFWTMTSNIASSPSMQALMHFYVSIKSGNQKADAAMNVIYGFPINVFSGTSATAKKSQNDGTLALSTGLKIYIAETKVPLADYYGFYALRMQPFFKATGGNEIDVVVNSARTVQCWSWGSYNGAGFAEIHTMVTAPYFSASKYFAAMQFKGVNMVICKIGVAAGTAKGDAIMIPATQTAPDGKLGDGSTDVNNPTPKAVSTNPLATSWESMKTACNGKNPAILAGSDEYLGTMTFMSNADTAFAGIVQHAGLQGTTAVSLPTAITQLNDNTNSQLYDIKPKTDPTTTWVIGAAKLDALLYFKQAKVADWATGRSVMTVCGPQAGSSLPTDLAITAGNTGTGEACTAAYLYTVGAQDWSVVTGYTTRVQRWCRWCKSVLTSSNNELFLKDFVPPTFSTRKIKGITILSSDTDGKINMCQDSTETATQQDSVVIASGGCGKSGQTTKLSTKGQLVEFTIKSPVPLAAGQFVMWEDVTASQVGW